MVRKREDKLKKMTGGEMSLFCRNNRNYATVVTRAHAVEQQWRPWQKPSPILIMMMPDDVGLTY